MKCKSNKNSCTLIISMILAVTVIWIGFFIRKDAKEPINPSEANLIIRSIKNETLTEMINNDTSQVQKHSGPSFGKVAHITIDDGPSKYTNDILDILAVNNVKATFFMINGNMKKHIEEVKRIEEEGHGAGFHSVTHDIHQLYKSPEITLNEFETCKDTFYNITGEVSKLIRVPYGSKPYMPEDSHELLLKYGYKMWDWNLDTQDWNGTTDNIVSNILYYGRNNPNLVILMHEKQQTVESLQSIIRVLKERGYNILPITEDIQEKNYWDGNL
ncbi:polysaccharide deacetylase family protein [Romboutsia sp.]|uniref:polysaccharide deacetylase family protein n=1 Tax=Romboutsia sp. TaxID=1965302 RepID=UPI002CA9DE81|nr:polysaccharide deacetylase family protein [Romboutsia sp.]HSQ87612.1 polysaccharide deacetylase family protein [Romboutsia sp.]